DLLPTRAEQSWTLMIEAAVERMVVIRWAAGVWQRAAGRRRRAAMGGGGGGGEQRREEASQADEGFMLIGVGAEAGSASNGRPRSTDPGLPTTEAKVDGYGRNRRQDDSGGPAMVGFDGEKAVVVVVFVGGRRRRRTSAEEASAGGCMLDVHHSY
ncbi:hypothetical protein ACLOJK_034719, partial [Asimina triloba]